MTEQLVTIGRFSLLQQAEMCRIRLEAEGFQPLLADAETVNMDWGLGNARGYIKLQVPQSQASSAGAILEKIRALQNASRNATTTASDDGICLSCGNVLPADQATCSHCGWSYQTEEGDIDPEVHED